MNKALLPLTVEDDIFIDAAPNLLDHNLPRNPRSMWNK